MPGNNANKADEFVVAYDRYCRQIDKEDNLVDQRLNWLFMIQSLLFAGVGLSSGSNPVKVLHLVIPWVGFWSSLAITLTVWAASASLIRYRWLLSGVWSNLTSDEKANYNIDHFPQLKRNNIIISFGLIPGILIPIVFCAAWYIVIIIIAYLPPAL